MGKVEDYFMVIVETFLFLKNFIMRLHRGGLFCTEILNHSLIRPKTKVTEKKSFATFNVCWKTFTKALKKLSKGEEV